MSVAVAVQVAVGIIENAEGRILVNQRPPSADFMPGFWEFPGGKVEPAEDSWQALSRELDEELGIRVVAGQPLMTLRHAYPSRLVELAIWRVTEFVGQPQSQEGQVLAWHYPGELLGIDMLPADRPLVAELVASAEAQ